jgi:ATP-dependent Clp protease ATP-binding subunit ClpB
MRNSTQDLRTKEIKGAHQAHRSRELADLKEKTAELELKWKNEKEVLESIRAHKSELDKLRVQAENAEAIADLGTAAEIQLRQSPAATERNLEVKTKRLKTLQKSRRILHEEVTEHEIAGVVSRWTGIPVSRMLEEEMSKLSLAWKKS